MPHRQERTTCPTHNAVVRVASERAAMKGSGECKKCSTDYLLGPPRGFHPPDCPKDVHFGHMPPDSLLPFSCLSVKHMRVNICFPVYFCHLRNRSGCPEKAGPRGLHDSSWSCRVILPHQYLQRWSRKRETFHCNREHQSITGLGIKTKEQALHSVAQQVTAEHLLYLKPYNRIWKSGTREKSKHAFCLCSPRDMLQKSRF